ncbi:hypothetical protein BGX20_002359, partial [Mortierella sp. AD010]
MSATTREKPMVIIIGAGLSGLLLGVLLDQIDIPYHIYERAKEIRPLGSALTLGASILPVFEQLGLLEELYSISLPLITAELYDANIQKIGGVDGTNHKAAVGYNNILFARPKLYELLFKRIPTAKITLGKKIARTEEKDGKVHIFCSDDTTFQGDILVGADGTYSAVRQSLYELLREQNILPKVDQESLAVGYLSVVGVAEPKDPVKYPQLKDNFSHFSKVLGKDNRSWGAYSVAENKICWSVTYQLSTAEANVRFRRAEWNAEANETILREFRDLPSPWGGTMGDLFDISRKENISKVFLQEKLFKTWYHGRTVLAGDACHPMLPGAGAGAVNAMQDSVVLANYLFNMPDSSPESITAAFEGYYKQRHHRAGNDIERSKAMTKLTNGQ